MKISFIILGSVFVCLVIILLVASATFKGKVKAEVTKLFLNGRSADAEVVTEAEVAKLPQPIQRYLRYAQVVGKPKIQSIRLKQHGLFRQKSDQRWMPLEAEQYYTVNPPSFSWFARIQAFPFASLAVRDLYADGKGYMLGKLLSMITAADASGPEIDQGALARYLNEVMWFPTAYLSDYLSWEPVDSTSAKVTMTYGGISASALLHIDDEGKLTNFVCDRYMTVDDRFVLEKWSTPITGYGEFNGFRIPTKGKGVWHLLSGDFSYIQLEVESIEYGKASGF